MPLMDGWEAARHFEADSQTAHIPVVVLSGQTLEGTAEWTKRAGCDGFVTKPCVREHLVREIRKVLES